VQGDGAISPENPGRRLRMTLKTFEIRGLSPKKEARPIRPGNPYALRRNIFRKRQKTMVFRGFG
jgi:hypothetical protein